MWILHETLGDLDHKLLQDVPVNESYLKVYKEENFIWIFKTNSLYEKQIQQFGAVYQISSFVSFQ